MELSKKIICLYHLDILHHSENEQPDLAKLIESAAKLIVEEIADLKISVQQSLAKLEQRIQRLETKMESMTTSLDDVYIQLPLKSIEEFNNLEATMQDKQIQDAFVSRTIYLTILITKTLHVVSDAKAQHLQKQ